MNVAYLLTTVMVKLSTVSEEGLVAVVGVCSDTPVVVFRQMPGESITPWDSGRQLPLDLAPQALNAIGACTCYWI